LPSILLIDDDADLIHLLREELIARGFTVDWLERAEQGPERLATGRYDLVLLDNKMPGMTGMDFLKALRTHAIQIPVILITSESTPDTAIQATKLGAFDYVVKAGTVQELAEELDPIMIRALEIARPVKEVRVASGTRSADPGPVLIGGKNRRMLEVYKLIAQFAEGNDPVLILGETGTGKELVARAFHTNSSRKGRPFVALNCAAIPENLLESELFGHEKGAHSQADKLRKGKIEYADGGTLFLDEVGDMPLELQRKLLRVIEYQSVERLGGNESIKVDVRLVSATHRDLQSFIQEGKFRRDLLHRLDRVTVRLPSLRERLDDLPELVEYFLDRAAATNPSRPSVASATLEKLRAHQWPGNVRELQNVIFRALGGSQGSPQLLPSHLDLSVEAGKAVALGSKEDALAGLRRAIEWAWGAAPAGSVWPHLQERLEEESLRFALEKCNGNQSDAAKKLGMGRTTLIERMKKYGIS
jgi:DNA-binding NtrC family response regulator